MAILIMAIVTIAGPRCAQLLPLLAPPHRPRPSASASPSPGAMRGPDYGYAYYGYTCHGYTHCRRTPRCARKGRGWSGFRSRRRRRRTASGASSAERSTRASARMRGGGRRTTAAPAPHRGSPRGSTRTTLTPALTLTQAKADGRQAGDRDEQGEAGQTHRQDRLQGQQTFGRKRAQAASAPATASAHPCCV